MIPKALFRGRDDECPADSGTCRRSLGLSLGTAEAAKGPKKRRDFSQDKALIVRGRLTTANLENAPIIGQCIPGILDVTGPWKSAAGNMVKRVETFARETYAELAEAQGKRTKARSAASQ